MIWLIIVAPLLILMPIAIYFDKTKGMGSPKLDTENYRMEMDLVKRNIYLIGGGPL